MPGRYTPPPTDRFRVLIVEDHEDTRELIHQLLEIAGALVTGTASADLALQAAAQGKFDVVLTDVGLGHSKQDGVWLLQRFAATPDLADIPFIALTGRKERKDELVAAGFTAVLIKPIDVEDIAAVVLGVARRHLHR